MAGNGVRVSLVGQGISASLTPAMHMAEGRTLGMDYSYGLTDTVTPQHQGRALPEIVETAQADGLAGLNITHPYKMEVIACLDDLSDDARKLGAVNTVVFRDGAKIGHNTDYTGFAAAFRQQMGDAPKDRVLLLGAGGAGAAIAFALVDCGVRQLLIHDPDPEKSQDLLQKLRAFYPGPDVRVVDAPDQAMAKGLNGLVNATPFGMKAYPGSAFPLPLLAPDMWVADAVYFPLETRLLAAAQGIGCRIMPGSAMAIWQAVHAFELFTGHDADPQRFARVFRQLTQAPGQV
ncbi:MAG: shikimate dehydrogenase [Paracoccaceae bacterium]|jgi:shikimate dehydrogenase